VRRRTEYVVARSHRRIPTGNAQRLSVTVTRTTVPMETDDETAPEADHHGQRIVDEPFRVQ
jgi:hypothetical protein